MIYMVGIVILLAFKHAFDLSVNPLTFLKVTCVWLTGKWWMLCVFYGYLGNYWNSYHVYYNSSNLVFQGFLSTGTGTDNLWISTGKYWFFSNLSFKFPGKYQKTRIFLPTTGNGTENRPFPVFWKTRCYVGR